MKSKTVTMADIARELGISTNAVSLALRGKSGVSDELRRRIAQKAREMNYSGTNQYQSCILALVPQRFSLRDTDSFYRGVCFQMEAFAASQDHQLIISSVMPEDEKNLRVPPLLNTVPCCGIITVGNLSLDYCRMIQSLGLPYVMADQYYDNVIANSVITANASASYQLTEHLIENGHRNIQFFGMPHRTASLEDRFIGYKRAMEANGLSVPDNPLLHNRKAEAEFYETIEEALNELTELPTAFVCGHDATAECVINVLAQRGLKCPDDFSVVGFDNIQSPGILMHHLTTYATPKNDMAETAVRMVLDDRSTVPKRIQLFGSVVYRNSVKKIGKKR